MHIHTKYEVSILNPVARRAVHRCQRQCQTTLTLTPDDNYARWTNHDYIGSFGRIPNEPKSEGHKRVACTKGYKGTSNFLGAVNYLARFIPHLSAL